MATTEPIKEKHPTAQTTIEAIMQAVRVRGPHALTEPENIERLHSSGKRSKNIAATQVF